MSGRSPRKDEMDFRELLRQPEKLIGYTYLYILLAILLLGAVYVVNLTAIGMNAVTKYVPPDSSVFVQDLPMQSPSVIPPVDVLKVGVSSDSLVARGAVLYKANCSSCHGETGLGDGPAGQ